MPEDDPWFRQTRSDRPASRVRRWCGKRSLFSTLAVIFARALVAAYYWDMWRVIPIQTGFYVTVLILSAFVTATFLLRQVVTRVPRVPGSFSESTADILLRIWGFYFRRPGLLLE